MNNIAAFTSICEDDAGWVSQYLAEVERLRMPFYIHLDRCSQGTKNRFRVHPLCEGASVQDNANVEYTEQHKQLVMDLIVEFGYSWALHWDIDETWERDFTVKLPSILDATDSDYITVVWVNLWGDDDHVRIDKQFERAPRVKLYNLQDGRRWRFDHPITYGCKMVDAAGRVMDGVGTRRDSDLVCLHHGLMTRELRLEHKARWDRIYGKAVGANPYGFWDLCLNEAGHPPTLGSNVWKP